MQKQLSPKEVPCGKTIEWPQVLGFLNEWCVRHTWDRYSKLAQLKKKKWEERKLIGT